MQQRRSSGAWQNYLNIPPTCSEWCKDRDRTLQLVENWPKIKVRFSFMPSTLGISSGRACNITVLSVVFLLIQCYITTLTKLIYIWKVFHDQHWIKNVKFVTGVELKGKADLLGSTGSADFMVNCLLDNIKWTFWPQGSFFGQHRYTQYVSWV